MGRVIAIANQKGGVGKTTTSVNLGAELGRLGKKVLLLDLDPQGNATTSLGIDRSELKYNTYHLYTDDVSDIHEIFCEVDFEGLTVVPATQDLSGIEVRLIKDDSIDAIHYVLSQKLNKIRDEFDFILIDCPPSLGISTVNAIMSADSILIPVQCQFLSLDGLTQLLNTIRLVQQRKKTQGEELSIEGILLTMLDSRSNAAKDVVNEIKAYFRDKVFDTVIPMNVKASEAPQYGVPLFQYAPKSAAGKAYNQLARELVSRNGK